MIAGGVGSFEPRKISLKDAEKLEGKSIFIVKNKENFKIKKLQYLAEGSALDWALELSKFSKITLIHRRNEFRGVQHTLSELKKLKKKEKFLSKLLSD